MESSFAEAAHHADNLDIAAVEHIAGSLLIELKEKVEETEPIYDLGKAFPLHGEAQRHFEEGRRMRPQNKKIAIDHFNDCIELCRQALLEIRPLTPREKRDWMRWIITTAIAGAALFVAFFAYLKK